MAYGELSRPESARAAAAVLRRPFSSSILDVTVKVRAPLSVFQSLGDNSHSIWGLLMSSQHDCLQLCYGHFVTGCHALSGRGVGRKVEWRQWELAATSHERSGSLWDADYAGLPCSESAGSGVPASEPASGRRRDNVIYRCSCLHRLRGTGHLLATDRACIVDYQQYIQTWLRMRPCFCLMNPFSVPHSALILQVNLEVILNINEVYTAVGMRGSFCNPPLAWQYPPRAQRLTLHL